MAVPGETESGSAGTQPDKGYPGRRCAKGASGPGRGDPSGVVFFLHHWTPSPCLENPPAKPPVSQGLTSAHASAG